MALLSWEVSQHQKAGCPHELLGPSWTDFEEKPQVSLRFWMLLAGLGSFHLREFTVSGGPISGLPLELRIKLSSPKW